MFEGQRSVPNTDENILRAIELTQKLDASYSGTDILTPLQSIFQKGQPSDCSESHILLLTAGDVHNFQSVVDIIGDNSQLNHRLHTFGIGNAVSKRLIKTGAIKGLGNYHLSASGDDLSEKMVSIITDPKPCYTVLQSIRIYD